MSNFSLVSKYEPRGDQPKAIKQLIENINKGVKKQVLLGATGTGKTFTVANIIKSVNQPTLVLAHNKTLAGQLYQELKAFFPNNHVEYFVSYFDFYQPEAYLPSSDTYIEKNAQSNDEIEMLRLSTLNSLSQYNDVIVVASVAAIYASASPEDFNQYKLILKTNQNIRIKEIKNVLVSLNYKYNDIDLKPGSFRNKGDVLDIAFGFSSDYIIRISFFGDEIEKITKINPLTYELIEKLNYIVIAPADEYILNNDNKEESFRRIENEMIERIKYFKLNDKLIEAQRIEQRTKHDLEAMREFGFCNGIENYSRHLELREKNQTPYTLFDFFNKSKDGWLLIVDESHMSIPQIRGMYNTDRSRKETLVEYGFRLPSALDNRPLNFEEFNDKQDKTIYISATPNEWEIEDSNNHIIEQIVRPTGLVDPTIEIRKTTGQIDDLVNELNIQKNKKEKTFISVMTIRMAEELTELLKARNIRVAYLHNELKTLERIKIINDLRRDRYDAVVGINLLREGIDVPEVSLVCIFDANKPGFFRSSKSLIQIIGRAARNANGRIIMYADSVSKDMSIAIDETNRRRRIQLEFNHEHNIIPKTIIKEIPEEINLGYDSNNKTTKRKELSIKQLKNMMLKAAKNQEYELAAELRDQILELSANKQS